MAENSEKAPAHNDAGRYAAKFRLAEDGPLRQYKAQIGGQFGMAEYRLNELFFRNNFHSEIRFRSRTRERPKGPRDNTTKGLVMSSKEGSSVSIPLAILGGAAGIAAAVLLAGAAVTFSPRPAQALPQYAAQTGFPCGKCHVNPAGGGPRNAFGKAFAANGHKVPKGSK